MDSRGFSLISGTGLATSASSHALGESSPPISPITMSHTTPSIYPTAASLSHNSNYQVSSLGGGYMSSSNYNTPVSQQYNSLSHSYTTNKSSLMTNLNAMGNLNTGGIGSATGGLCGQIGQLGGTLGTSTLGGGTSTLGGAITGGGTLCGGTSLGGGVIGGGSSSLGTNIVPPSSYSNCAMSNTTFTNPLSAAAAAVAAANNPVSSISQTAFSNPTFNNPITSSTLNQYSLPPYNPVSSTTSYTNNVTFSNPLSSQLMTMPLSGTTGMSIKLKPLEEVELGKILDYSSYIKNYVH